MKLLLSILLIILSTTSYSQVVGTWNAYFNTNSLQYICSNDNYIYAGNNSNIIQYNIDDFSINEFNKVNQLNDVDISGVFSVQNYVMIAYSNGNIDVVLNHNQIQNIPDIKINNNILGSKQINDIQFYNNTIYVATDFGIVLIDPNTFYILDTYVFEIGSDIYPCKNIRFNNDTIYALSEVLLYENINSNLKSFNNWDTLFAYPNTISNLNILDNKPYIVTRGLTDSLWVYEQSNWTHIPTDDKSILFFNDRLINLNDSIYLVNNQLDFVLNSYDGIYKINARNGLVLNNEFYFADQFIGLIQYDANGYQSLTPSGPNSNQAYYLNYHEASTSMLVTSSNSVFNSWNTKGVSRYSEGFWNNITIYDPDRNKYPFDIIDYVANDDLSIQLFASNFDGLIVNKNNQNYFYHQGNSTFTTNPNWNESCAITGLAFNNQHFVICNSNTGPLSVYIMDSEMNFYAVKHNSFMINTLILKPIFTENHQIILPTGNGIVLIDTKGTYTNPNDDVIKVINESNSDIPSNGITALSLDLNNNIIVGTNTGFAILSNWETYLNGNGNFNLYQPLIEQDGFVEIVLGETPINNICVDPGNRKWIATKTAGLYLLDPTMKYQELYFTPENSPLLDYNVNDVTVNESTGEVFISSPNGIISYQHNATAPGTNKNDIVIYPSPVPPNYEGNILIKQTPENASIRIVDQNGLLVRNLETYGGAVEWNLKNTLGQKVSTGIYYFIISSDTDQVNYTSKILIK